jgi:hypothetical protein
VNKKREEEVKKKGKDKAKKKAKAGEKEQVHEGSSEKVPVKTKQTAKSGGHNKGKQAEATSTTKQQVTGTSSDEDNCNSVHPLHKVLLTFLHCLHFHFFNSLHFY